MKKVILITGGGDGLGKELATVLSKDNEVIILDYDRENLEKTATDLGCSFFLVDIRDSSILEKTINEIINKYQKIDVLVNCAGIWVAGPLDQNEYRKISDVLDINTKGLIFTTRAVLPFMKREGTGLIMNIISRDGLYAKTDRSVYHASKWAITGFTKCLELELAPLGIDVVGCYPGLMKTKMFDKADFDRDLSKAMDPKDVAKSIVSIINESENLNIPEIILTPKA